LHGQDVIRGRKRGKEIKKRREKPIGAKPDITTIHSSLKEKEDTEMHQMMRLKLDFNHRCQSHAPPKGGKVVDACQTQVNSLFYMNKTKNAPVTKQQ
jgi:hypothetical protein